MFGQRPLPPVGLGGQQHLVVAVGDEHLHPRPPPALLVGVERHGDHDDAEQHVVLDDAAGIVEAEGAVVVLDDGEDGGGVLLGGGEIGLVAVVLLARALVAGRHDAALGVEQEDRAGADLLAEGGQPVLGAAELARAQRQDQDGVAREQQRHHRMPLDRRLDRAGVERGADRGVGLLLVAEGAGEVDVAGPDHQEHPDHGGQEAGTRPEAARRRMRARRVGTGAHRSELMTARAPPLKRSAGRRPPGRRRGRRGAASRRCRRAADRRRARGAASAPAPGGSPRGCRRCRAPTRSGSRRSGRRRGPRPPAGRACRRRRRSCRRGARSAGAAPLRRGSPP